MKVCLVCKINFTKTTNSSRICLLLYMSNKLSDKEFIQKYAKEQYERYPEILEREQKLSYDLEKMMMKRQNTINLEAKKQDKPCISSSSSCSAD